MRQFRSSTGRVWSVELARADQLVIGRGSRGAVASSAEVLRFSSPDGLVCDLEEFPPDWDRFTETGLLSLLGQAMSNWARAG